MKTLSTICALLCFNLLSGQSFWNTYPEDTAHPDKIERMVVMNYSQYFQNNGLINTFENLTALMIIGNDLDFEFKRIPADVLQLPKLQSLYIINTKLEQLDNKLHNHPTIQELFLYNNAFLRMDVLDGNTRIKKLFADNNIDAIPNLSGLEELTLFHYSNKGQYQVPAGYKKLKALQRLNLFFSRGEDTVKLSSLFSELGSLKKLRNLNMYFNNWNPAIQSDLEKFLQKKHPALHVHIYLSVYYTTFDEKAYIAFANKYNVNTSIYLPEYTNIGEWLKLPNTTYCFESFNFWVLNKEIPKEKIRSASFSLVTPTDLYSFSQLENLNLDVIALTPDLIKNLIQLPYLKKLTITPLTPDFVLNIDFDLLKLDEMIIIANISEEDSALLREKAKRSATKLSIYHIPALYMPKPFIYYWE